MGIWSMVQFVIMALTLFVMGACQTDEPTPETRDTVAPTIQVSGVSEGDTLTVPYDTAGNSIEVVVSDAAGLAGYTLNIDNTDINISKEVSGTQVTDTVDVSDLKVDTTYAVAASATDAAGNVANFNFTLLLTTAAQSPYDSLFMIGSATPAGWNIGSQIAMTKSGSSFTWDGTLIAGELKFPAFSGSDWCGGDWILAEEAGQPVENAAGYTIFENGCASDAQDFKWTVTTAGEYKITVNLESETVTFELLGETTGYDNLYLVGDATPGGWDLANETAMTQDDNDPLVFSWEGALTAGGFKIATNNADFNTGDWIQPAVDAQDLSETSYVIVSAESGTDNKWTITEEQAGNYKITVNLALETINIEFVPQYYQALYLVGDATPGGWDLGSKTAMNVDTLNPAVFTVDVALTSGSFKIAADNADFGSGDWIHPLSQGQSLTATDFEVISDGSTDNQWAISEATTYRITVDLENKTINIGAPYANLYLVGDATASGWDPYGASTQFTRDASDIYKFTYTGDLTAGQVKIHLTSGDWCVGDWINAATADQVVTDGSYQITTGCDGPDNKWTLTDADAGTYLISVDLKDQTLTFEKQ